jgi:hypothetical protein
MRANCWNAIGIDDLLANTLELGSDRFVNEATFLNLPPVH